MTDKRMSEERLAEIESWLLDDPDFYINCTEQQATDAIRELLTAVRALRAELTRLSAAKKEAERDAREQKEKLA